MLILKPSNLLRVNSKHRVLRGNTSQRLLKKYTTSKMTENEIAQRIIGLAIEVHKALGPGLLESAYKECLYYKILNAGLFVEKEKPMPLIFENIKLDCGYRVDLVVEKILVVEIKSVDAFHPIHLAQTLTYLKLGNFKLALLINFKVLLLKDGVKRIINGVL